MACEGTCTMKCTSTRLDRSSPAYQQHVSQLHSVSRPQCPKTGVEERAFIDKPGAGPLVLKFPGHCALLLSRLSFCRFFGVFEGVFFWVFSRRFRSVFWSFFGVFNSVFWSVLEAVSSVFFGVFEAFFGVFEGYLGAPLSGPVVDTDSLYYKNEIHIYS